MKRVIPIISLLLFTLTTNAVTLTYSADGMICTWDAADLAGFFTATSSQMRFSVKEVAPDRHCTTFTSPGWSLKEGTTYYAYAPYNTQYSINANNASSLPVDFFGQKQTGNDNTAHLADKMFCYGNVIITTPTAAANINMSHMAAVLRISHCLGMETRVSSVELTLNDYLIPMMGNIDLTKAEYVPLGNARTVSVDLDNVRVGETDELVVYMAIPPCDLTGEEIKLSFITDGGIRVEQTLVGQNIVAGKTYCIGKNVPATTATQYTPVVHGTTDSPVMVINDMPIGGTMVPTAIPAIQSVKKNITAYDLGGRQVKETHRGIVIENGKKKIRK